MALESPLGPSPGAIMSAFYKGSPVSTAPPKSPRFSVVYTGSEMMRDAPDSSPPTSARHSPRPSSTSLEPIDPSPITSDKTDIDDSAPEEDEPEPVQQDSGRPSAASSVKRLSRTSSTTSTQAINTSIQNRPRSSSDETPLSVIHAPEGFRDFGAEPGSTNGSFMDRKTPSPTPLRRMNLTVDKPADPQTGNSPVSPPPISTAVEKTKYSTEDATPRAHTRQEVEAFSTDKSWRPRNRSLEDIPEALDPELSTDEDVGPDDDDDDDDHRPTPGQPRNALISSDEEEIDALKTALTECWTLCNTLAGLSFIHRQRIFYGVGSGDAQPEPQAWRSCWKLCQKLYESRDQDHDGHVMPILDLCREFCQSLFDVRQRTSDVMDSVLRVSFELNNHLYNSHDRNLPEVFRERTLDFYITLCHRLMKQRTRLAEETDSLLRTCWSLAEMLFSLRQNRRQGKPADKELLGSAVQACWDLCDLFREGWTQIRPDRATPRPTQTTFGHHHAKAISPHNLDVAKQRRTEPETPTTIFEDMALSPDGDDGRPPPNILVLGTDSLQQQMMAAGVGMSMGMIGGSVGGGGGRNGTGAAAGPTPTPARWSSSASSTTLSDYSQSSRGTSSTVKTTTTTAAAAAAAAVTASEDSHLNRLKMLILKAAMNSGFQRNSNQTLFAFGKTLNRTSFGHAPWQMDLLENYQHMILTDSAFRTPVNLPSQRVSASEMARAVEWMVRSGQYTFLADLFRLVVGFAYHEADQRAHCLIQT